MNTLIPVTRMLDAALNHRHEPCGADATWNRTPRADVLESEKEFRILMDMPGVISEDLDISLENQTLTVKAERTGAAPEGFEAKRRERPAKSAFTRHFNLGNVVAAEGISANLDNGVLQISLPKSEQSLPRKIEVQ